MIGYLEVHLATGHLGRGSMKAEFDLGKVFRTSGVILSAVLFIWLYPLLFKDFPYFQASPDGLSDYVWFPVALSSPILVFIIIRLILYALSPRAALALTDTEISGYRIPHCDRSEVCRVTWAGSGKGPWPGDRLNIWLRNGSKKTVYVTLFRDQDAAIVEAIASELSDGKGEAA